MTGGISVHAVDIAHGCPAHALRINLLGPDGTELVQGTETDAAGMLSAPNVKAGQFQAVFHIGTYFRACGYQGEIFQEVITFPFGIDQPIRHHHLPLKFTPFGFSLFLTH